MIQPERIAIVGSRRWADMDAIRKFIYDLLPGTVVISGGAHGADTMAAQVAAHRGLPTEVYKADWNAHGKQAGFLRNLTIVEKADRIVAFWDGESRGTAHTIKVARAAKKPVQVIGPA